MVGSKRAAIVADDDEQFDTQALIRLAAWGLAAAVSLVADGYCRPHRPRRPAHQRRLLIAIAAPPGEAQPVATAQLAGAHRQCRARGPPRRRDGDGAERRPRTDGNAGQRLERDIGDLNGSVARARHRRPRTSPLRQHVINEFRQDLLIQSKSPAPARTGPQRRRHAPQPSALRRNVPAPKAVAPVQRRPPRIPGAPRRSEPRKSAANVRSRRAQPADARAQIGPCRRRVAATPGRRNAAAATAKVR